LALAEQAELRQLEIMAQTVYLVLLLLPEGEAEEQLGMALREDRAAAAETIVIFSAALARRGKVLLEAAMVQARAPLEEAVLAALD
jgi:hypothetical protein